MPPIKHVEEHRETVSLRKWAVEQAVALSSVAHVTEALADAEKIERWVLRDQPPA